ncbi:thioesterase II family protein [Saccharopolyspora dendranthemae]|uniref:Surfactin synthase thioesterase subunit n=1 Tax=Saccharopolyspora dendranthemae TaxID=1181886 RepID=A0A561U7Z5_9PSEU|nr:alpha/beta fold hydrolase [Saccharopolyspora dendranthemae]TWF95479.1 surfactin synthase thioesterase subunit [Saccharopolyspora dendranthemae]
MASPSTPAGSWFRRFHPRPDAEVALVCLPHAGGAAGTYFSLSQRLSEDADVISAQYPGRQDRLREPCLESVRELASGAAPELDQLIAGRPFVLFGHSMGAAIAFELALSRRRDRARAPHALFLSGRGAPGRGIDRGIRLLDDDGLIAEVRRLAGTDSLVLDEPELVRLALPSLRADYAAAETYDPGPGAVVDSDVVALTGDADDNVGIDDAEHWREHTTGAFDLQVFEGGHFFLNDHEPRIAELLGTALRGARGVGAPGGEEDRAGPIRPGR